MTTTRILRAGATVLLAAALWTSGLGAAHAADDTEQKNDSEVSVSVPVATSPAIPPVIPPVQNPPPAGTGGPGGAPTGTGSPDSPGPGGGGGVGSAPPPAGPAGTTTANCVPKEPAVPSSPATGGGAASVDREVYSAGDTVSAAAGGFGAGEQVQFVLFGEPKLVGTITADASGSVTAQFVIAAETLAGSHTLQFTGWCGPTSSAEVFVGAINSSAVAGIQGVPPWLWWIGGVLGAMLLLLGAWWVIRVMRTPAAAEAVPA